MSSETQPAATSISNVTVHFGTNRVQTAPPELFGTGFRQTSASDRRLYVTGKITVGHSGDVFSADPSSMVLDPPHEAQIEGTATVPKIVAGKLASDDRFASFTRSLPTAASAASPQDAGLFFLPGFANTFINSVESAARIAVGYGATKVICFSWPSLGVFGYSQYRDDQSAALKSGRAISLAITSLLAAHHGLPAAERPLLHLVSHSMGAHALAAALQLVQVSSPELLVETYFAHAALMAADEDADGLAEAKVLHPMLALSKDVNVYTNNHDLALLLSGQVNRRGALGLFGPQGLKSLPKSVVWLNCTVAADQQETSGHGHSYFDQSPLVMNDVRQVFGGTPPGKVTPRVVDPNPQFDGRRYTIGTIPDDA